jgi:alkylhydroperoxidase/carboxymuconolactone decarboxylase family protein YurZ
MIQKPISLSLMSMPEFGKMAVQMGQGFKLPGVSLREKSLLCLANDVCEMNLDLAFQMHVALALANGISGQEIREILYHLAPKTGYAKVLQAIVRLNEIEKREPASETVQENSRPDGSRQSVSISTELRARLEKIDARFGALLRQQIEERWNRPGLTPKERAYISLTADVSAARRWAHPSISTVTLRCVTERRPNKFALHRTIVHVRIQFFQSVASL